MKRLSAWHSFDRDAAVTAWKLKNREYVRLKSRLYAPLAKKHRDARAVVTLALVSAAKSAPCMDCRRTYPKYVMDLDHREPEKKLFNLSQHANHSIASVEAELAKCDAVCSNCHRVRTERWKTLVGDRARRIRKGGKLNGDSCRAAWCSLRDELQTNSGAD